MDLLHNYPGFQHDIEVAFKDLIEEFDLKLTERYEGSYLLNGTRCILWITYDRGQIGCAFKQITDDGLNPGYEVWSVDRQLYPIKQTAVEFSNGDWATPKQQLEGYSNVIRTKFKNILNGDFSWLANYSNKQSEEDQLSLFVLGLNDDHPIYKKFWAGDISWMSDAENQMREKSIKRPAPMQDESFIQNVLSNLKSLFR